MSKESTPYERALSLLANPRLFALVVVVGVVGLLIAWLGEPLLPFFVALVLAYLLDGGVRYVERRGHGRGLALSLVFSLFLLFYVLAILGPLQLAVRQALLLGRNLPGIVEKLQNALFVLAQYMEDVVPMQRQEYLRDVLGEKVRGVGEKLLAGTIASIPEATTWLVYALLIPLVVFFLLKDKRRLLNGVVALLPKDRELVERVWGEVEGKISNYVRGKVWEILIVGTVTALVFFVLDFRYAAVLGLISGISVVIPLVGALAVAFPVFVLGYVQWGLGAELGWLMLAYVVIQVVDGNVLVPFIFSEAVKLPPLFILLGVVVFGFLWGFWGVFFAIPLATVSKSLMDVFIDVRAQERAQAGG